MLTCEHKDFCSSYTGVDGLTHSRQSININICSGIDEKPLNSSCIEVGKKKKAASRVFSLPCCFVPARVALKLSLAEDGLDLLNLLASSPKC